MAAIKSVINSVTLGVDLLWQLVYRAFMVATRGSAGYQGMNWIRQEKRLAIYIRDGMACAYCGADAETSQLTLDHVKPFSQGGSNGTNNLITACLICNSRRGTARLCEFAEADVIKYVRNQLKRVVNVKGAKAILEARRS